MAATFGRASSFGGRQSSSSSSLKHIVSALLSDHVPEEDPMSAPVSPSPTPPQPPTATAILVATAAAQLLPPTLSPAIVTAATAAPKPAAKPAARPASKPAARPAAKPAIAGGGAAPGAAAGAGAGLEDVSPSTELGSRPSYRDKRFDDVLGAEVVKLDELRKLSWNGVPPFHRPAVWQLLVGYMPANRARRVAALERKRREYREAVPQYFDVPDTARSHQEQNILRQILVDVPRTCPDVPFFHQEKVWLFVNCLYCTAVLFRKSMLLLLYLHFNVCIQYCELGPHALTSALTISSAGKPSLQISNIIGKTEVTFQRTFFC